MILQRDVRTPPLQSERRLQGHRQEVCGLKWSTDHQLLASGGNDNTVQSLSPSDLTLSVVQEHRLSVIIDTVACHLSYWCGITLHSAQCKRTWTTSLQSKPSPGPPTNMACWPPGAEQRIAVSDFGTP